MFLALSNFTEGQRQHWRTVILLLLVERPALAVRLDLCFRSVYLFIFLSGNIFRTAEPISTKVCTVTASG